MSTSLQSGIQQIAVPSGAPAPGSSNVTVLNPPGGTTNVLPKFTGAASIGDSSVTDDGTTVSTTEPVSISVTDAATVTTTDLLTLTHTSSGVPGVAFGAGILYRLEDSGGPPGATENAARISARWIDPAAASEDSEIVFERRVAGAALSVGGIWKQGLTIGVVTGDPGTGFIGTANAGGLMIRNNANGTFVTVITMTGASDVVAIGNSAGQTSYVGGAMVADSTYSSATGATRTGLKTDYIVSWTETTTQNSSYQAIAMGAAAGQRIPLIIKDESYSGAYGLANTRTITLKPVSGKKLNNVVNGTLVILNGGGVISVIIDENDNMHQLGFTP